MTLMAVRKISVSLDERVLALARTAAEAEGKSLSAWLSDTAEDAARIQAGIQAMDEWEAEYGAFTEQDIRTADEALDRLGVGRDL
jgi:hypothetical protein